MQNTLYEINQQLATAIELYEAGIEDVVDTETGEVRSLADCMADLQMAFDDKVEGCVLYMKNLKAEEEAIKAEMDALKKRADAKAKKRGRLEEYIRDICPDKKYESPKFCLKFRQSEGTVVPTDYEAMMKIPAEYRKEKTTVTIDKTAVKKAIKAGQEIPGCYLETKRNMSY